MHPQSSTKPTTDATPTIVSTGCPGGVRGGGCIGGIGGIGGGGDGPWKAKACTTGGVKDSTVTLRASDNEAGLKLLIVPAAEVATEGSVVCIRVTTLTEAADTVT